MTIPRGEDGTDGTNGTNGPPNVLSIGTVTTGEPGSSAQASIAGTSPTQTLSLTIPRGDAGVDGLDGVDGVDANPPDSGIDSTDFAESIATRTVGEASADEIAGFFVGAPEAKTLADLLDVSEAGEKSNYKILVRKHEAGERPVVAFIPVGDLTNGTEVVDPGVRDPDDEADSCGEGGYPGIDPGDGTDGFPGSGDDESGGYPGDGTGGDGTGGDGGDYPGKGNDCW
jgi:hypothetical protein